MARVFNRASRARMQSRNAAADRIAIGALDIHIYIYIAGNVYVRAPKERRILSCSARLPISVFAAKELSFYRL